MNEVQTAVHVQAIQERFRSGDIALIQRCASEDIAFLLTELEVRTKEVSIWKDAIMDIWNEEGRVTLKMLFDLNGHHGPAQVKDHDVH